MSLYLGEPACIDPYNTQESEGTEVEQALFDSLTRVDPLDSTKLRAAAAKSWASSHGATVWTFTLNRKDQFSNGQTVKASDFVYAWTRIVDPRTKNTRTKRTDPSYMGYLLTSVKGYGALSSRKTKVLSGVTAVNAYTFRVTLTKPCADFPYVVSHPALAPVPKSLVTGGVRYGRSTVAFGNMPVGNGPFMMSKPWSHGSLISLKPNPHYYGAKPYLAHVDFKIYADPDSGYTDFLAGKLDFSPIGDGQMAAAKAAYGTSDDGYTVETGKQVLLGAENSTYYLVCNTEDSTLGNPFVRKAISLAIDRQAICDAVFEGRRLPADNIIPPGVAGYAIGGWADSRYDPAAARQALADGGFPGGVGLPAIQLSFNSDGGHAPIMERVKADLTSIGLTVTFRSTDFPNYLQQLTTGDFQFGRLGWIADYPIAENFLSPLFRSGSIDNYSAYGNPDVDAALNTARKNTNTASRIAAYQSISATIAADDPVIPLMFYRHSRVGSARLHGFTWDAQGFGDFAKAWVQ
jgi:oligopeptide transport system substrate-binding protein